MLPNEQIPWTNLTIKRKPSQHKTWNFDDFGLRTTVLPKRISKKRAIYIVERLLSGVKEPPSEKNKTRN